MSGKVMHALGVTIALVVLAVLCTLLAVAVESFSGPDLNTTVGRPR